MVLFSHTLSYKEKLPEMNSQFLHLAFVVRREPNRTLLVDELDHASEALIRRGMEWDR